MSKLTSPSFTGLPTDKVATVDPYEDLVDPRLRNVLKSNVSAFSTDMDSLIGKSLSIFKGIGQELFADIVTPQQAVTRIQDVLSGSRAGIGKLTNTLTKVMTEALTGTDDSTGQFIGKDKLANAVQFVLDQREVNRYSGEGNFASVRSIMGFIGDLTDNPVIDAFDLGAEAALIRGVLSEVTGWGIPDIIDSTFGAKWNSQTNKYDYRYDDTFRFSVIKSAAGNLSPYASLDVIIQLIEHGGPSAITAGNPQFPNQLMAYYKLPLGIAPGGPYPVDPEQPDGEQEQYSYYLELKKLVKVLDALQPNWFEITRTVFVPNANDPDEKGTYRDDTVWNLTVLKSVGDDARALLLSDPKYRDAVLTAPFYEVDSPGNLLRRMYPYIVWN